MALSSPTSTSSATEQSMLSERLRTFEPIHRLTHSSYRDLLGQTMVRSFPGGSTIFQPSDANDWLFFLLDGTAEVIGKHGEQRLLTTGTDCAKNALNEQVSKADKPVRAHADCTVARVPVSLLEVLLETPNHATDEYHVAELEESEDSLTDRLMYEIMQDYMNDELKIPSLPDVAMRIRSAVDKDDVTANEVERIITADPAVAARIIQIANSPAYAGTVTIETCRDAVVRLGLGTTRDLVTSFVLKQLFKAELPLLERRMQQVWQHSTRVAAICFYLAKAIRGFSPDRAMLAGLVHDIGVLPVLESANQHHELIINDSELQRALDELRGQVGAMVLRHWSFPEDLVEAALSAEDWERSGTKPDYADLVAIAQLLSFAGTPQFSQYPTATKLSAFARLGLGEVSAEDMISVLADAETEINAVQSMLGG